jgi:hypothetical protein
MTRDERIEAMARAILADDLRGTFIDFDKTWAREYPAYIRKATAAHDTLWPLAMEEAAKVADAHRKQAARGLWMFRRDKLRWFKWRAIWRALNGVAAAIREGVK